MSLDADMTSHACNVTQLAANGNHANGSTLYSTAEMEYTMYFTYIYRGVYAVGLVGNLFALVVWARSGLRSSPVTYFQAICLANTLIISMSLLQGIYTVGLTGNLFALVVWARSGLRSSPVTYFQAICVADSLVLVMHPLETLPDFVHVHGLCQLVHVLFLAVQVFAILLVLGLTFERYIELCHPLLADRYISYKRTVRAILVLASLSLLFSLCEAYIWHVPGNDSDHDDDVIITNNGDVALERCQLRHTTSPRFMWAYAILVLVVLFLCPLLLVVLFNLLVARRIRRRRKNSLAYSVSMVPDKHNMNLSVTFVSLYLAVCEIVYAAVHSSQYFVSDQQLKGNDPVMVACVSNISSSTTGTPQLAVGDKGSGGSSGGGMPLTGRWHSFYIDSLPLYIADVLALTSYAVDVTIFTLCSRTFRRNIARLFQRYQRRKSLSRNGGYRVPADQRTVTGQRTSV